MACPSTVAYLARALSVALVGAFLAFPATGRGQPRVGANRYPGLRTLTPGTHALDDLRAFGPEQRLAAVRALRTFGDARQVARALRAQLLTEGVPEIREAIVLTLALRIAPEDADWLLPIEDAHEARRLGPLLIALRGEDAVPALLDYLEVPPVDEALAAALVRAQVPAHPALLDAILLEPSGAGIALLGALGDPAGLPVLLEILAAHDGEAPLKAAVIRALGQLGDARGLPAVRAALRDGRPAVLDAAQEAILELARTEDVEEIERVAGASLGERRQLALGTLLALAPERGAARLVELVTDQHEANVRLGTRVALSHPTDAAVPVLYGIMQEGTYADEAASTLARLPGERGAAVLLRELDRPEAQRGLAVALHRGDLSPRFARRARTALASLEVLEQGRARLLVLRALAGDASAGPALAELLREGELPVERAWAASGLGWLGDYTALATHLPEEHDLSVLRATGEALLAAPSRPPLPRRFFRADALLPTAIRWRAEERELSPAERRARRTWLYSCLQHDSVAVKVAAVEALARTGERGAWRWLRSLVLDSESLQVRRAAAWGLARLGVPGEARPGLLALSRVLEPTTGLAGPLRAAGEGRVLGLPRGRRVLRLRVAVPGFGGGVPVSIALPDGRVYELLSLPTGEILMPGLPPGDADVQVQLD